MEEREKVELFERIIVAWNAGDMDAVLAECIPELEWDCTHSGIPGQTQVYRGRQGYMNFARSWRGTLRDTHIELEEARALGDGRLFAQMRQTGTGAVSGIEIDTRFAQISSFEGSKLKRSELFGNPDVGRERAGLDA